MVTFADSITREELSRIAEGAGDISSLDEFIRSLDFSTQETNAVIASLAELPDVSTSSKALPKNAPDLFRNGWWA